jgi:Periplasmic protease
MRISLYLIFLVLILNGCISTKTYNQRIEKKYSPKELRQDVDFVKRKLVKLHPDLYWYISKENFDKEFDSLKLAIKDSLTSQEFYYKLAPLVSSVRQGHTRLILNAKRYTTKETNDLKISKFGYSPLDKVKFGLYDGKLFVTQNSSWNKDLKVGYQLCAVNGRPVDSLLAKFRQVVTSDGYNETFLPKYISTNFNAFLSKNMGRQDSLLCSIKVGDTSKTMLLKRIDPADLVKDTVKVKKPKVPLTIAQRDSARAERNLRFLQGYDSDEKVYMKELTFYKGDSSIAVLKIRSFSEGNYSKFYRNTFKKLDSLHTKMLVIDLRNNLGGRLNEVENLYSYLSDTTIAFTDPAHMTSLRSIYFMPLRNVPLIAIPFIAPFYPLYAIFTTTRVSRSNGEWYYRFSRKRMKLAKEHRFSGKVYVLINGNSFSASSIISSNLKGSKRATFIGEETGGAYNGTVAGVMPFFKLPNSMLSVRIGVLKVAPHYKTEGEGFGIKPDIILSSSLDDVVKGVDKELDAAVADYKKGVTH